MLLLLLRRELLELMRHLHIRHHLSLSGLHGLLLLLLKARVDRIDHLTLQLEVLGLVRLLQVLHGLLLLSS